MEETGYWQSETLSWEHRPPHLSCLSQCNLTCLSPASSQSPTLPEAVPCREPHLTGTELWELHICAPPTPWKFRIILWLRWVIYGQRCCSSTWHEEIWFSVRCQQCNTCFFSTILNFINDLKGVIRKTAAMCWALSGNTNELSTHHHLPASYSVNRFPTIGKTLSGNYI